MPYSSYLAERRLAGTGHTWHQPKQQQLEVEASMVLFFVLSFFINRFAYLSKQSL